MKKESNSGISFFQRYLTVWVIVCMLIGIMLGHFLPGMKEALNHLEYAGISIPLAVLIWIMIYPMMMKVDFKSIKNIGKNPKGLFVTWIVNWLGRFRRAFVQMMKQQDWYRKYMEQKLIKGFVAFSAIIICQQRMCCLNMFVIIRNEQGYFKDQQIQSSSFFSERKLKIVFGSSGE